MNSYEKIYQHLTERRKRTSRKRKAARKERERKEDRRMTSVGATSTSDTTHPRYSPTLSSVHNSPEDIERRKAAVQDRINLAQYRGRHVGKEGHHPTKPPRGRPFGSGL